MKKNHKETDFAKLDFSRYERTGMGETVYCPGKTKEQLAAILRMFHAEKQAVLGTRCSQEQFDHLKKEKLNVIYDPVSRVLLYPCGKRKKRNGTVAVCTGGTADIPVAEEAAQTAEFFGADVQRHFDVGVAGLHRLLSRIDEIRKADVVIAIAGMEGALGSVIAGLVEAPVVAVPTSVGYGASFGGIAPLLAMLNSCAEGISTVNIDNGFGAGVFACRIIRIAERKKNK